MGLAEARHNKHLPMDRTTKEPASLVTIFITIGSRRMPKTSVTCENRQGRMSVLTDDPRSKMAGMAGDTACVSWSACSGGSSRLRKNYSGTMNIRWSARVAHQENTPAGCSKRSDFSPAQPWSAETRLIPRQAAASEGARRYRPHLVWAVHPCNGSWRTKKPLQPLRPSGQPFSRLWV